jgi:hypothetical protein
MLATTCHALRKRLPFGPTNSSAGTPPLEGPGSARCSRSTRPCCCGRRNLQCKSEHLRWDRPDLNCEPQQARGTPRNLQVDETRFLSCPVELCEVQTYFASDLAKSRLSSRVAAWFDVVARLGLVVTWVPNSAAGCAACCSRSTRCQRSGEDPGGWTRFLRVVGPRLLDFWWLHSVPRYGFTVNP